MIPSFPIFAPLLLDQREEIESITSSFPPYSDFNFISLWLWNLEGETSVSILNDNLIIKLPDYLTSEYFYTFIGNTQVDNTIRSLFIHCNNTHSKNELKCIPEHNLLKEREILEKKYFILEDINNYDYIFLTEKIAKMEGKTLHHKRKMLNKFLNTYSGKIIIRKLTESGIKDELLQFFYSWQKKRNKNSNDTQNELIAIQRLFLDPSAMNVVVQCAYVDDQLIGYTIFEELKNSEYAESDFQKGDIDFEGVYEFLNFTMADHLYKKGYKFINVEQDLGILGLRRAKQDYGPVYLKKYSISPKT